MSEPLGGPRGRVQRPRDDFVLPPHYSTCLGCGPDAPQGYHLEVRSDGAEVVTEHVFQGQHSGAPGIAHGGAVATVADDLLGHLLSRAQILGVTRHLEVDYLRPVLIGVPYAVRGTVRSNDGRKVWAECAATAPDGVVVFRATALFLRVDQSHFSTATDAAGSVGVTP